MKRFALFLSAALLCASSHAADMTVAVDTALTEIPVNKVPLIDDGDFKTIEGAVAYNASGMALRWHFVTTAGAYTVTSVTPTTAGTYDWTDQGDSGVYTIEIPASGGASINNDTEGYGWFTGVATGVLPWTGPVIQFSPAMVPNSLVNGTDKLEVDTVQWLGTAPATPTTAGVPEVDATFIAGQATTGPFDPATDGVIVATGGIAAGDFAAGAIDASAIAADAGTELGTAAWATTTRQLTGTQTFNVTGNITGNLSGSVGSVTGGIGTSGGTITTLDALDTAQDTQHATTQGYLDTEVAAILADTNELQTDWANGGRLDLLIDAIKAVTDLFTTAQTEPTGAPAANETPLEKLGFLFATMRNKITVTATEKTIYDDSNAEQWDKELSDDGSVYTETEAAAAD